MRRQQANGNTSAHNGGQTSSFEFFQVPGSRFAAPSSTASNGSGGGGPGIPLTVGPSIDTASAGSGSGAAHRNSSSSTIQASPPYRESMPDGMGFDDYDSVDSGGGWMRTGRVVRIKETGQSFRFPLEEEHLPQIELSRQDILQLRESMEMAIQSAVANGGVSWMENPTMAPANSKFSWKVHLEKKNCILYRRKNDTAVAKNFLIRCKLECSMNDAMYGVMSDNTEDERTYLAHVHRDDFLDGAVVRLLARPNVEDPYQLFAIKWAAFQSPVDSMYGIRDMLYVEYSRTVVDPKGQTVVARVFQSLNPKQFHTVEREFNFVRTDISWTQLFRVLPGSNDTKVDVSLCGSITFPASANTPSWLANRFLASQHAIVTGMATAGDAKFIVNNQLVSEKPWVPNGERSACHVCFKSFSLLRHRHHCRICAEIMCTACTLELALRTSTLPPSLRPEGGLISAEKFCFKCVEQSRRDREISLAHELAMASAHDRHQQQQKHDGGFESEPNKENAGGGSPFEAYAVAQEYSEFQHHHHQQRGMAPHARTASSHSSDSGGGGGGARVGGGMNGGAWSNKVLTAIAKEKPDQAALRVRTNTAGPERIREATSPQEKPLKLTHSLPTVLDASSGGVGGGVGLHGAVRHSVDDDATPVAAMPSSFAKMEESIAAQQLLLRNMLMEGQKIMQQQQYYGPPPVHTRQYAAVRAGPQIDVIDDHDATPTGSGTFLALPPSTSTSETM